MTAMASVRPPNSDAGSIVPLPEISYIGISQLTPLLSAPSTLGFKAVITLIWPYSSSTQALSVLLVESDFRLRRHRGQVKVHFSGSCARAIAKAGIQSGNVLWLGLDGVEWIADEGLKVTPGRGIEWELKYTERIRLQIRGERQQETTVYVDHPSADPHVVEGQGPHPLIESPLPAPSSPPLPASRITFQTWSSPAFLKRTRVSHGSFFESAYDPFEIDETTIESSDIKRTKYGRESGEWSYAEPSAVVVEDFFADALPHDQVESITTPSLAKAALPIEDDSVPTVSISGPLTSSSGSSLAESEGQPPHCFADQTNGGIDGELGDAQRALPEADIAVEAEFVEFPADVEEQIHEVADQDAGGVQAKWTNGPSTHGTRSVVDDDLSQDLAANLQVFNTDDHQNLNGYPHDNIEAESLDDALSVVSSPLLLDPFLAGLSNAPTSQLVTHDNTQQLVLVAQESLKMPSHDTTPPVASDGLGTDMELAGPPRNYPALNTQDGPGFGNPASLSPSEVPPLGSLPEDFRPQDGRESAEKRLDSQDNDLVLIEKAGPSSREKTGVDAKSVLQVVPGSPSGRDHTEESIGRLPLPVRGLRTPFAYFTSLSGISSSFAGTIDALAVIVHSIGPSRAKSGLRDYFLTAWVADSHSQRSITKVQIFRPYRDALPRLEQGDRVLLRAFKVISISRKFGLLSTDESAWAVWKGTDSMAPEIRGPPVEFGEKERLYVGALWSWWMGLDAGVRDGMRHDAIEQNHMSNAAT